jgi:hypothetical protein
MGTVTRGTVFEAGKKAKASEVNAEIDNLVNEINGNLENININATADIDQAKIADISNDEAAAREITLAGNSGSPTLPSNLEAEVKVLRSEVRDQGVGRAAQFYDTVTTGLIACGWQESAPRGQNRLANPSFEMYTSGSGTPPTAAPDGWTLEGSPATMTTQVTAASEGTGFDMRVIADAANEGVSQTFSNLKAGSYYLFGCRAVVTVGSVRLVSDGGVAGSDYEDFDLSGSPVTYTTLSAVVRADGAPAPIKFSIISSANGDDFKVDHAFLYELGDNPIGDEYPLTTTTGSGTTIHRATDPARTEVPQGGTVTFCHATVTTPTDRPCYIEVTGTIGISAESNIDPREYTIKLETATDGVPTWGTYLIDGLLGPGNAGGTSIPGTVTFHFVVEDPGFGEQHDFRIEVENNSGAGAGTSVWVNGWTAVALGAETFESSLTAIVRSKL